MGNEKSVFSIAGRELRPIKKLGEGIISMESMRLFVFVLTFIIPGGFSFVVLVEDVNTGEKFAVKKLSAQVCTLSISPPVFRHLSHLSLFFCSLKSSKLSPEKR